MSQTPPVPQPPAPPKTQAASEPRDYMFELASMLVALFTILIIGCKLHGEDDVKLGFTSVLQGLTIDGIYHTLVWVIDASHFVFIVLLCYCLVRLLFSLYLEDMQGERLSIIIQSSSKPMRGVEQVIRFSVLFILVSFLSFGDSYQEVLGEIYIDFIGPWFYSHFAEGYFGQDFFDPTIDPLEARTAQDLVSDFSRANAQASSLAMLIVVLSLLLLLWCFVVWIGLIVVDLFGEYNKDRPENVERPSLISLLRPCTREASSKVRGFIATPLQLIVIGVLWMFFIGASYVIAQNAIPFTIVSFAVLVLSGIYLCRVDQFKIVRDGFKLACNRFVQRINAGIHCRTLPPDGELS